MNQFKLSAKQLHKLNENILDAAIDRVLIDVRTREGYEEMMLLITQQVTKELIDTFGKENITEETVKINIIEYYKWRRTIRYNSYTYNAPE